MTTIIPIARAFISQSHHSHFNLSFEHHLLRSQPANLPVAFIYQNEPCIVIGRNQNPWHELDVSYMRKLGIKLVRRRSGGGAVYHDLGNANYSFHIAREQFTRRFHAELVARALNNDPIRLLNASKTDMGDALRGAFVNDRNDICIALKPNPTSSSSSPKLERKISGSAYKIITSRAYHHGTMLLSANLGDLGSALRPQRAEMESKGVASVPSTVMNLIEAFPSRKNHLTYDGFCTSILQEFRRTYGGEAIHENVYDQDVAEEVRKGWLEMDSWEWTFGQTPEFTHSISNLKGFTNPNVPPFQIKLHVKNGRIKDAQLVMSPDETDNDLGQLVERLKEARYDILADAPDTFGEPSDRNAARELKYDNHNQANSKRELEILNHILPWFKTVL